MLDLAIGVCVCVASMIVYPPARKHMRFNGIAKHCQLL